MYLFGEVWATGLNTCRVDGISACVFLYLLCIEYQNAHSTACEYIVAGSHKSNGLFEGEDFCYNVGKIIGFRLG